MFDWLTKELIDSGSWTNSKESRHDIKEERINGRLYAKFGINCATTITYFVYKAYDPSSKTFKYAYTIGVARQNPGDTVLDTETGIEIAAKRAMIDPSMVLVFDHQISKYQLYKLIESYVESLPIKFVKTKKELMNDMKTLNIYNRNSNKKVNNYYKNYYNDFKNMFMNKNGK